MNKFPITVGLLKEISRTLTELNFYKSSPKELCFSIVPDDSYIAIEAIFFIEIDNDHSEMVIGQSIIDEKYISEISDKELLSQIVGDIIIDVEQKLLARSGDDESEIVIH